MSQGQPDSANPEEGLCGRHSESAPRTPTQRADEIAADQYVRWQRGERVRAEEYLRLDPQVAANVDAACDVVYGEFLLREDLGEAPELAEYLDRFPWLADGLRRLYGFERLNDVMILVADDDDDSQRTDSFTPLQVPLDNEAAGESILGMLAEQVRGHAKGRAGGDGDRRKRLGVRGDTQTFRRRRALPPARRDRSRWNGRRASRTRH